jgi:IclR helix-turn-helix domain
MPGMTNDHQQPISITLSPAQIDEIVRAAAHSRAPSISALIADSLRTPSNDAQAERTPTRPTGQVDGETQGGYLPSDTDDPRLSRSLVRGLSILTCFGPDGAARGIVEIASDLGMSPSTTHRYASTLVELGLLERCPKTRKYRLPGT